MAEVLEQFPRKMRTREGPPLEWFDGRIWRINWKEDAGYASVASARASLHAFAKLRGLKLVTQLDDDNGRYIVIQVYKEVEVNIHGT